MSSQFYELESVVKTSIQEKNFSVALDSLKNFVSAAMNVQSAPGEVVGSRKIDELCELVGDKFFQTVFGSGADAESYSVKSSKIVIVCTGLYKYGGTSLVIRDLVRAHPGYDCTVLATNYLENMTGEDLKLSRIGDSAAVVSICPTTTPDERLKWLIRQILDISPARIFLLNHHQDSVIIAGARPFVDKTKVLFYHHADYNICLGVHMQGAIHVDPHNVGFYNCRNKECIQNNVYIPMTVDDIGSSRVGTNFIQSNELTTCSSGHSHKFHNFYLYQYTDLIVSRFKIRTGKHIHIGGLPDEDIASTRQKLIDNGIDPNRFIHIPWTSSLWKTLIDKDVDLFIGSFPIGGARSTIEAMGAGIPILMPENYLSRFFSSRDIVYREAFVWKYPKDFKKIIAELTAKTLEMHSIYSRAHYDSQYNSSTNDIKKGIDAICSAMPTPAPYELYPYNPDHLDKALHFGQLDTMTSGHAVQKALASIPQSLPPTTPATKVTPNEQATLLSKSARDLAARGRRFWTSFLTTSRRFPKKLPSSLSQEAEELYRFIVKNPASVGFDAAVYLKQNLDVAQASLDPIYHLVAHGQHEGRESSLFFSPDWYAEMNPSHAGKVSNMLLHLARTRSDPGNLKVAFFSYAWNYARQPDPYMREMIAALANLGINVDVYIGEMFAENQRTKGFRLDLARADMGNFVKSQSYDFAISFNNALIFSEIVRALRCKVVSVVVDSVYHLFDHTQEGVLQAFKLPIHVAPIYTSFIDDYAGAESFTAGSSFLPAATRIGGSAAAQTEKPIEISWIANFLGDANLDAFMSRVGDELPNGFELVARCLQGIEQNGEISLDEESQEAAKILMAWSHWDYPFLEMHLQEVVTNAARLAVVDKLAPLGLRVYGNARWRSALTLSQGVSRAYRSGANLRSHADLRAIYDQSKISINLPQVHAGTGMQYRIIDILASQSLLITKHVPGSDMEKLFGSDSPIVTFSDLDDLQAKCAYYLKNENERRARVDQCNALVARGFSFQERALEYLAISNPKQAGRVGAPKGRGSVTLIWPERVIEWAAQQKVQAA
ncbi:glycosyltransferase [Methylobacterium sp. Leaf125]|uniref:glycosyltransferase family protein n=1 Tax=Methylobacterium sp. Leaf125 TaxID=1736265 RepID=UPI0009EC9D4D|nr:glycosyltransferase [Methylobacterium sp. Leaf125]